MHGWAEIDCSAFAHNLEIIRRLAPQSKVSAVVKANAYGHGLQTAVRTLKGRVDGFSVATCDEALQVRALDTETPVWVLLGASSPEELEQCLAFNLTPVIAHRQHYEWCRVMGPLPLSVVVEIDVGMGRLGLAPEELPEVLEGLEASGTATIAAILGHFPDAENPDIGALVNQYHKFEEVVSDAGHPLTLANSAAILQYPDCHLDWVRPGLMLYGVSPLGQGCANELGLKPVMRMCAQLGGVRQMQPGATIGYGSTFICPREMLIGLVRFGYADGYPRQAVGRGTVVVRGQVADVLGRVAMDSLIIDASNISGISPGDVVELWGPEMPVEYLSRESGVIAHQILTSIGPRIERREVSCEW